MAKDSQPYEDPKCPFCGKGDCFEIVCVGADAHFQGRTKCGFTTKLCNSKDAVRLIWGTRGGRRPTKLLNEMAALAKIKVTQNPTGEVAGRVIGGQQSQVSARRRSELEAQAQGLNRPSEEAMREAAGTNKTGMPDEPF